MGYPWVMSTPSSSPFDLVEAMEVLGRTPAALRDLLQGLPDGWITADEGPDTFSPLDVLGHLIQGERADWMARARRILERGTSVAFEPFDRVAHRRVSAGRSAAQLLEEFAALRRTNLDALRALDLSADDLAREGLHPAFGTVTLEQLLATWVVHDLSHLAQIARVMGKRYRDAVGPWRAYLPMLDR